MGSSKKKGQQRKAAKNALSAAAEVSSSGGGSVSGGVDSTASGRGGNSKIVAKVRRGNNYATKRLNSGVEEGFSYEDSGVLSVVLDFLNRCEDETFEGVMNNVGGDLKSPSLWVNIIKSASFVEPSCRLQIVENIGPLARCMCDDVKRLFFKSNKHWVESVRLFVHLVGNVMMESKLNNFWGKIVDTLLQYEGLLSSIVQWSFLGEEYRPDIIKELKYEGLADDCIDIISISRSILNLLVSVETGLSQVEESRIRLLKTLGTTPIINQEYDPSCTVSYTAGLARRLKTTHLANKFFGIVQCLIRDADCVDKGVITEIIDLGTNYTKDYDGAFNVALISLEMIHQGARGDFPGDTRTAFAIRSGLLEMCLGFIERFGEHKSFGEEDGLHDHIKQVFRSIYVILLHKKTAKAIINKRHVIEGQLVCLEQTTAKKSECENLLDVLRSILDISGSYCCRCNKPLSKTEVKQCNGCTSMVYCSRSCQKEDWLNGHDISCCESYNCDSAGQFQGRFWPPNKPYDESTTSKLMDLEINMSMVQLKLFLDHSETILRQAETLDIPLCDCVAMFDLRDCPVKVEVKKYTYVYEKPEEKRGFEEKRSKENITCLYYSSIYIGQFNDVLIMQRFSPLEWLMKQSK